MRVSCKTTAGLTAGGRWAVLKAGSKPGKAAVTINSAGVEPVTIYLEVE